MAICKAGYGDLKTVESFSVQQVLDIIEFEDISADIEYYQMEQARKQNGND